MEKSNAAFQALVVTPDVDRQLRAQADQGRTEGRERCGFLLGEPSEGTICAYAITGPGERATMTPVHCEPDYVAAAVEKQKLAAEYGDLDFVAGWHLHLGYGGSLSGGDIDTMRRVSPSWPGFVALLIDARASGELSFNPYVFEGTHVIPIDYRVESISPRKLKGREGGLGDEVASARFDRTRQILPLKALADARALVVGVGTGGSVISKHLGRAGVMTVGLIDPETLETVNLSRHEGLPADVGRPKVEIMADQLKAINAAIRVETHAFDVLREPERLSKLVSDYHVVLACPGDPRANALINDTILKARKPAVFGGSFRKAIGGFVLQVIPDKSACFNCLFDQTRMSSELDSNDLYRDASRRYGVEEKELRAQQGMFIDVSFIALLQAKMGLLTLLRNTPHDIGDWKGNLILWNSHDLSVRSIQLQRREDCASCNYEGYLKSVEQLMMSGERPTSG